MVKKWIDDRVHSLALEACKRAMRSQLLRKPFWRLWYERLSKNEAFAADWPFLNYGYVSEDAVEESAARSVLAKDLSLELSPSTIPGARLYQYALQELQAVGTPVEDLDCAEIGSGRGGGGVLIAELGKPRSHTCIELSGSAVEFCTGSYNVAGLRFVQGEAGDLPLEEASVDVVFNVESSHCYPEGDSYLDEVVRVLRPGGMFVWLDVCLPRNLPSILEGMPKAGLEILVEKDITENVVLALREANTAKVASIQRNVNRRQVRLFTDLHAAEGSALFEHFENRDLVYPMVIARSNSMPASSARDPRDSRHRRINSG